MSLERKCKSMMEMSLPASVCVCVCQSEVINLSTFEDEKAIACFLPDSIDDSSASSVCPDDSHSTCF